MLGYKKNPDLNCLIKLKKQFCPKEHLYRYESQIHLSSLMIVFIARETIFTANTAHATIAKELQKKLAARFLCLVMLPLTS